MEPGASNGIVGDITDLPTMNIPEEVLNEEKSLARFSKTKEFKRLKEYMENRITFFQKSFPDGTLIAAENDGQKVADYWRAACIVIGEFQALLNHYENASQVVDEAAKRNVTGRPKVI